MLLLSNCVTHVTLPKFLLICLLPVAEVVVERTDTELVAPDMTYPSWSGSAAGGGAGGIIVLAIVGLAVILFV